MGWKQYDINRYHHNGCWVNAWIHPFLTSIARSLKKTSVVASFILATIPTGSNCSTACCTNQSKKCPSSSKLGGLTLVCPRMYVHHPIETTNIESVGQSIVLFMKTSTVILLRNAVAKCLI